MYRDVHAISNKNINKCLCINLICMEEIDESDGYVK